MPDIPIPEKLEPFSTSEIDKLEDNLKKINSSDLEESEAAELLMTLFIEKVLFEFQIKALMAWPKDAESRAYYEMASLYHIIREGKVRLCANTANGTAFKTYTMPSVLLEECKRVFRNSPLSEEPAPVFLKMSEELESELNQNFVECTIAGSLLHKLNSLSASQANQEITLKSSFLALQQQEIEDRSKAPEFYQDQPITYQDFEQVKILWDKYQDVAHLGASWSLMISVIAELLRAELINRDLEQTMLKDIFFGRTTTFLATAQYHQRIGLNNPFSDSKKPFLSSETLWLIPQFVETYQEEALPLI